MKSIELQNNVEHAHLLITLFPSEAPAICEMIARISNLINKDAETLRPEWKSFITFEMWQMLGNNCAAACVKYGDKLKKARLFADQLTDGYMAFFTNHCIIQVATETTNQQFKHAIYAIYGPPTEKPEPHNYTGFMRVIEHRFLNRDCEKLVMEVWANDGIVTHLVHKLTNHCNRFIDNDPISKKNMLNYEGLTRFIMELDNERLNQFNTFFTSYIATNPA